MQAEMKLTQVYCASKKWHLRDLNLRSTDPETDTFTAQPPRLTSIDGTRPHLINEA